MINDRPELNMNNYDEDDVSRLEAWAIEADDELQKLRKFKQYVHERLSQMGVPSDPDPVRTSETGCRIGSRLNYIQEWIADPVRYMERHAVVVAVARQINDTVGGKELAQMPKEVGRLIVYLKTSIQNVDSIVKRASSR